MIYASKSGWNAERCRLYNLAKSGPMFGAGHPMITDGSSNASGLRVGPDTLGSTYYTTQDNTYTELYDT